MIHVGAYEAKTHFSGLLEKVSRGEQVIITKHHVPFAKIVPADSNRPRPVAETIKLLRNFRKGKRLRGLKLKSLMDEGRK